MDTNNNLKIAVVIPSFRVKRYILNVINKIPSIITHIYVVDDACPDESGNYVQRYCKDQRIRILRHNKNQGVGGAVITGYQTAIADKIDIIVKIDGDGQMDPSFIPTLILPIVTGEADYTKGNRFFNLEDIRTMPKIRIFGNTALSLMCKMSSGYWNIFDPTNGYTAIHANVLRYLPLEKISRRYFFETDMLFRLNTLRAVVVDIPMGAKYGGEISNMHISNIIGEFFLKHARNFFKRIFYNYYLRDMSLASLELPIGILFCVFGLVHGSFHWVLAINTDIATPTGTVMMAALPALIGLQFILAFLSYDISLVPQHPIHNRLLYLRNI